MTYIHSYIHSNIHIPRVCLQCVCICLSICTCGPSQETLSTTCHAWQERPSGQTRGDVLALELELKSPAQPRRAARGNGPLGPERHAWCTWRLCARGEHVICVRQRRACMTVPACMHAQIHTIRTSAREEGQSDGQMLQAVVLEAQVSQCAQYLHACVCV